MVINLSTTDLAYNVDINNVSIRQFNGWFSGCDITTSGLVVTISSGDLYFQGVRKNGITETSLTLPTPDTTNDRIDLIAYDGTDIVVLQGTPSGIPKPPTYNIEDYVILYLITVQDNITSINSIRDVRVTSSESNIFVPIGGIISWHRNIIESTNTLFDIPPNFVFCNGGVIDDDDSPINGATIPNLNQDNENSRFLRGSTESGEFGGEDSHDHTNFFTDFGGHLSAGNSDYDSADNIPPNMNINWIMRIK